MTKSQEQVFEWTKEEAERLAKDHYYNGEVKEVSFKELETGTVLINFCVGLVGDEDNVFARLCREYGYFFVGKKGGIQYTTHKRNDKKLFHRIKRYPGLLLRVHCEQNHPNHK